MTSASATASRLTRSDAIDAFLAAHGWEGAERAPVSGDASFRRYERVTCNGDSAILMDAPPDKEDVRPFCHIARYLTAQGFSAPRILAEDVGQGFLLLEDLGDDLYSRYLRVLPAVEAELYAAAIDALVELHRMAPPEVPAYDTERLLTEAQLLADWHLPTVGKQEAGAGYLQAWGEVLKALPTEQVLVLRDYHADNLLWLPSRQGLAQVGMLDFQDAVLGHPAYDLVSLLEDARRDVPEEIARAMIARYLASAQVRDVEAFRTAYAIFGAQRNCKIIGIFHRLNMRDGKPQYLDYLPRVWRHLAWDLAHPALTPVRAWFAATLPERL